MSKNNSDKLYKAIDKLLGYSLPPKLAYLNIELFPDSEPIITVKYIADNITRPEEVLEEFTVRRKRK